MMPKTNKVPSRVLIYDQPKFELITPGSNEFAVYGDVHTVRRAREWAVANHYLLARGVPACAHGLYMMSSCPNSTCRSFRQLDHINLWVSDPISGGPFLLAHPYVNRIDDDYKLYARAHGLDLLSVDNAKALGDDWYGEGTIPIRLSPAKCWPVWPIEAAAAAMMAMQPYTWSD